MNVTFEENEQKWSNWMGDMVVPGTTDHAKLKNRDAADQHPIEAITGLKDDLYAPMRVELDLSEFEKIEGYLNNQGSPVEDIGFNGFFYKIPTDDLPEDIIVAGYADYNVSSANRRARWALAQDNGDINDYTRVNSESESCVYDTIKIGSELSYLYLAGNNDFAPKLFHIVDQSFPKIKGNTDVVWTTIWRWKDSDATLNDDQGWRYTHEHNFWDYWNLAKQGKLVIARGLTGQPENDSVDHELYGLYYLSGNSVSDGATNGRHTYNVNFLRMSNFDLGWAFNSSDVNLQCERYVVLYRDGKTWSEMKYSFIPELPSDLTTNRNYEDHYCVPAVQNAGSAGFSSPDLTLLLSNVDFPTFTTTNTKEKFDYALSKAHEHPDLAGVDTLASTAPHLAHLSKYVIPHNLVNPDDNDVKLGWKFYNTSTIRMTGSGTAHWVTTGYIPVTSGKIYYLTETNCTVRAFTSDKTFVKNSWTWLYTGKSKPSTGSFVTFAEGIKYARFSFEDAYYDTSSTEDISTLNDYFLRNYIFVGEFIGETYDFSPYNDGAVDIVQDPAFWKSFDFSNLPNLKSFRWNLIDPSKINKGTLADDTGEYIYSDDTETSFSRVTWFTPVESNVNYTANGDAAYCYDASQTFLSRIDIVDKSFTTPADAAYVRLAATSESDVPKMSLIVNGYGRTGLTADSDVKYDECIPVFRNTGMLKAYQSYLEIDKRQVVGNYVRYDEQPLSDEQKRQARENICAEETGTWELIENITIEEEGVMSFTRRTEPDGTPYDLRAIKVIIKYPSSTNAGVFDFRCYNNSSPDRLLNVVVSHLKKSYASDNYRSSAVFVATPKFGVYDVYGLYASQGGPMSYSGPANGEFQTVPATKKINAFSFFIYENIPLDVGMSIEIYGVRA